MDMDIKTVTENSRIFSEFLELKVVDKRAKKNPEYVVPFSTIIEKEYSPDGHGGSYSELSIQTHVRCSDMLFHSSWDWLMVIVEKIEGLKMEQLPSFSQNNFCVSIRNTFCQVISGDFMNKHEEFKRHSGSKLDATYEAVVEFIKWYNENK